MALELNCPAFKNNEYIPSKYSCEGENVSPALSWSGAPQGTKSFVLIIDDPDAPMGDWVHWLVYDIPEDKNSISENASLKSSCKEGKTSFDTIGFGGPCPPPGKPHRYFFKLYSLDTMLNLPAGLTKQQLLKAMEGHILGKAQLLGLYKR